MTREEDLTTAVKSLALETGFVRVGIAPAGVIPKADAGARREFLARGFHASMTYLERSAETRLAPERLLPGARSVICLAVGYAPRREPGNSPSPASPFVARYARGRDYHRILAKRCRRLVDAIRRIAPQFEGRAFVDTAPLAERSLARLAGLGWLGRNGCLIVPGLGSYVLLAEIVCNLSLSPDGPMESRCGDCRACVEACPSGACTGDMLIDSRRCVSYLTIEHRGAIPAALRRAMGLCVFGCDACQEVCPYNRDLPAGDAELLDAPPPLGGAALAEILSFDESKWDLATRGCATRRAKLPMLLRNAAIAAGNSAAGGCTPPPRDV